MRCRERAACPLRSSSQERPFPLLPKLPGQGELCAWLLVRLVRTTGPRVPLVETHPTDEQVGAPLQSEARRTGERLARPITVADHPAVAVSIHQIPNVLLLRGCGEGAAEQIVQILRAQGLDGASVADANQRERAERNCAWLESLGAFLQGAFSAHGRAGEDGEHIDRLGMPKRR